MSRTGKISRKTKETELEVAVDLDGRGDAQVSTGVPFFDHMLETLAKHAATITQNAFSNPSICACTAVSRAISASPSPCALRCSGSRYCFTSGTGCCPK